MYVELGQPAGTTDPQNMIWRDAARGARWGLEYLDLLRDVRASELTSQLYFIR